MLFVCLWWVGAFSPTKIQKRYFLSPFYHSIIYQSIDPICILSSPMRLFQGTKICHFSGFASFRLL